MDLSSKTAILRLLIPQIPFILKTSLWHTLYLSPTSTKWDLRTELIVHLIRHLLHGPSQIPASIQQKNTTRDPGIKGRMWISKTTFPPPFRSTLTLLLHAIDSLKTSPSETYTPPPLLSVTAEWTGYRPGVDAHRPRPDLTEAQHYNKLLSATTSPVTLLYFHGGAHFLMDPATHRQPCSNLARRTGGRVLSVRYRLAPQNPFPAALLDAFIAYLALLYPPPGSLHTPVSPSNIVFAGDSAGGNISFALLQLLLEINRSPSRSATTFHTTTLPHPLPLPAGCATASAWLDMTACLPSKHTNAHYDYLPPPLSAETVAAFPRDDIWPAMTPRGDIYCETSMLAHPLVSPLAARDWRGCCPCWMGYGEEMLLDEGRQVAGGLVRDGGVVRWEEWEGMPHCFGMVLVWSWMSRRFFRDWAGFCVEVAGGGAGVAANVGETGGGGDKEGGSGCAPANGSAGANGHVQRERSSGIETHGTYFTLKEGVEREVNVRDLAVWSQEEVEARMAECREARHLDPEGGVKMRPKL